MSVEVSGQGYLEIAPVLCAKSPTRDYMFKVENSLRLTRAAWWEQVIDAPGSTQVKPQSPSVLVRIPAEIFLDGAGLAGILA